MQPTLAWFVFLARAHPTRRRSLLRKALARSGKSVRESSGDLNSLLVEDIQGNRLIQTFGLQKTRIRTLRRKSRRPAQEDPARAMYRWSYYSPIHHS